MAVELSRGWNAIVIVACLGAVATLLGPRRSRVPRRTEA